MESESISVAEWLRLKWRAYIAWSARVEQWLRSPAAPGYGCGIALLVIGSFAALMLAILLGGKH